MDFYILITFSTPHLKKKILGYFSCINDKSHAKFAKGNNIAFCPLSINC